MLLIGIGYVVAVPHVGYIPALAALIACTAAYQAREFTMRILAVGLAGAVLLWVLFVLLLGIPQPQGPWSSLF
jgi:putative tricarboxylic transport membrane protein